MGLQIEVFTRTDGIIMDASDAAPRFLNVTYRSLVGRDVRLFFDGDRQQLQVAIDRVVRGGTEAFNAKIRPREMRPVRMRVTVAPAEDQSGNLRWVLTRAVNKGSARPAMWCPFCGSSEIEAATVGNSIRAQKCRSCGQLFCVYIPQSRVRNAPVE